MIIIGKVILAIDPGSQKCGIAIVNEDGKLLEKSVITTDSLLSSIKQLMNQHSIQLIVIGDRTKSKFVRELLGMLELPIEIIDENNSSREGRYRYLQENSRWWQKLLPIGLRTPDKPYDDYVAVILAERFLSQCKINN